MAHKTQGMTRAQIAELSLQRRTAMLSYIERQGRVDANEIVAALDLHKAIVFQWLLGMIESGHVVGDQVVGGTSNRKNFYLRGENRTPLEVFAYGSGAKICIKDAAIHRKIVKAKQIGIPRDPMIAALFGPAVAA